jgi:voltage-gated potassium channel Kch
MRFFLRTIVIALALTTFMNFEFRDEFGLSLNGETISTWSEAFYFTTVSLTTLGYGDITPTTSLGRLVASIQSIFGFSLFALLASMFFRRVAP